jgi:hypothetical protein
MNTVAKQNLEFMTDGFVQPTEIKLDEDSSLMYVPILESLKQLLKHDDVQCYLLQKGHGGNYIKSYFDGSAYQKNDFLSHNTIQIKLYIDDFQIVSPIGNKAKQYKMCALYWKLGNLPARFQSKLYTIQLLTLTKTITVKKFGLDKILQQPLEDLKILENQGVELQCKDGSAALFKGSVNVVIADNLAAHEIGGYIESFNSLRTCRFCNVTKKQMQTCFSESEVQLQTPEMYNEKVACVEQDPTQAVTYGLKKRSCLNELSHYHICWGIPSDVAHDIFEGFGQDVLSLTLEHLLQKRLLTLAEVNYKIKHFPYSGIHKTNKPLPLSGDNNKVTVRQTAIECLHLLRLLPLIIGDSIPQGDEHWVLYTEFLHLLDYILAPSLCKGDILYMKHQITDFLRRWFAMYKVNVKPKAHYLVHYATQYIVFGPIIDNSTLRFGGKHSYFKKAFSQCKNHRNPCKTMATKHQYLQCYHHQSENFLLDGHAKYMKTSSISINLIDDELKEILVPLSIEDKLNISESVIYNGITYTIKSVVATGHNGCDYSFGCIKYIISCNRRVNLILNRMEVSYFDAHLHSYRLTKKREIERVAVDNLISPHCLPAYAINDADVNVILPHFIQYD